MLGLRPPALILFKDAGVEPGTATLISALFPLGGFGAIFSG